MNFTTGFLSNGSTVVAALRLPGQSKGTDNDVMRAQEQRLSADYALYDVPGVARYAHGFQICDPLAGMALSQSSKPRIIITPEF